MTTTRKAEVHATQWLKDGDHAKVTPYEDMSQSPTMICRLCDRPLLMHGWLTYRDDGFVVHPGDWIVEVKRYADDRIQPGTLFACRPEIWSVIKKDFMIIKEAQE